MRFVVVRLFGGGSNKCCFFDGRQTGLIRPRPNQVQSFPVNFTVESNTNPFNGLKTQDYIAVSPVSGTGVIPMRGNGRHNVFNDYFAGNTVAAFLYPRLGAQPNDSGGGRQEDNRPGFEVLLQAVWCPAGQTCGAGGGGGAGGDVPGPPVIGGARFGPTVFRVGRRNTPLVAARATRGSTLPIQPLRALERTNSDRASAPGAAQPWQVPQAEPQASALEEVHTLGGRSHTASHEAAGRQAQLPFTGRIRGKALARGRYRVVISASDGTGKKSKAKQARFRIVR